MDFDEWGYTCPGTPHGIPFRLRTRKSLQQAQCSAFGLVHQSRLLADFQELRQDFRERRAEQRQSPK